MRTEGIETTRFTSENQPKKHSVRKGMPNIKTIIKILLEQEVADCSGSKISRGTLMNDAIIKKALSGDVNAYKAIVDRLEGAPKQEIDQTIHTPEPLTINFSTFEEDDNNKSTI